MSLLQSTPSLVERSGQLFERGDNVLWTLSAQGAFLHNFESRRFLELDELGYRTWAFLDGARSVEQVVECVLAGSQASAVIEARVDALIATMVDHGFVQPRCDDG